MTPRLRLKIIPKFPARILTSEFLTVTAENGTYTFGVDYTQLSTDPVEDADTAFVAVYDAAAGFYRNIALSGLPVGLDADLVALAALSGAGMLARTGTGTAAVRTITGTVNEISVSNGDGILGDPTLSLPASMSFTGKTIAGGTFSGANLGTPTAITLTNGTGLPVAGISDLGAGVGTFLTTPATGLATFLNTPSSANLAAAVTGETGTGALVFANAPTLVSPIVGTQAPGDNSTKGASTAYVEAAVVASIAGVASIGTQVGALTIPGGSLSSTVIPVPRYDAAQSLTSGQQTQVRDNIGVQKKNYIINGAMMVSQENGTTVGNTTGVTYYAVDQFFASGINAGQMQVAQVAAVTPSGSPNRFRCVVTTADASLASGDFAFISTYLEGLNVADFQFGTANAKNICFQFGAKGPAGMVLAVSVQNGAFNRCRTFEYTCTGSDQIVTIPIPGDQSGTWAKNNTTGMIIRWSLMSGSSYNQTPGSWAAFTAVGTSTQGNFMGTLSNSFELFDVGLYEGDKAPPFVVPHYADELARCQRYFELLNAGGIGYATSTTSVNLAYRYSVRKRASPTLTGLKTNPNISSSAAGYIAATGATYAFSSNAATDANGFVVNITGFSGLVSGTGACANDNVDFIKSDARL
jgi:hypothetical protein